MLRHEACVGMQDGVVGLVGEVTEDLAFLRGRLIEHL